MSKGARNRSARQANPQGQVLTDEMKFGIQCVVCGVDYREDQERGRAAVHVADYNGGFMAACRGECARSYRGAHHYQGHPDGYEGIYGEEEKLWPLEERLKEWKDYAEEWDDEDEDDEDDEDQKAP